MNYIIIMILFCQPLIQSILESIITSSRAIFGSAYVQLQEEVNLISILSGFKKITLALNIAKTEPVQTGQPSFPVMFAISLLHDFKVCCQYGSYKDNTN